MSIRGRRLLDYSELLIAVFFWGSLYPASKPVMAEVSATQVSLVRSVVAFLVLGALVLAGGKGGRLVREVVRSPWPSIVLGVLSFALSSLFAMLAVRYLPASVVGMFTATAPLWLSLAVIALHRPKDSMRRLMGAALALAGVALVLFREGEGVGAFLSGDGLHPLGVLFAFLCALVITLQAAWGQRIMPGRDPIVVSCLGAGWSLPILLFLVFAEGGVAPLLAISQQAQLLLLFVGVCCTALTFSLFYHALQRVPAEQATAFQYLTPFISALLAFAFLGEPLTWQLLLGGVAIISGVALIQDRKRRQNLEEARAPSLAPSSSR